MVRKLKQIITFTCIFIIGCTLLYKASNYSLNGLIKSADTINQDSLYPRALELVDSLKLGVFDSWVLNTNANSDTKIKIPDLVDDPAAKNSQDDFPKFDPRFSIGIVLNYLRNNDKKSYLPYFHWSDWCDTSFLNKYYLLKQKATCSDFKVVSKQESEIRKPEEYCIEDKDIPELLKTSKDENFKGYLQKIQESPYSTNFHIFSTGGRSSAKNKRVQSKSYLVDFMPAPKNLVFLLPNNVGKLGARGHIVQVNQEPSGRIPLVENELTRNFIKSQADKNPITIDPKLEIELFESDTTTEGNVNVEYNQILEPSMFSDRSEEILQEFNQNPELVQSPSDKLYKESLEYSLSTKDQVKYFYEAKLLKVEKSWAYGGHYDWRFFNRLENFSDIRKPVLSNLLAAWFQFTQTYNIKTWIAHGSLLSWYWNAASFPWDLDIDVQMPISELHKLSRQFNQSIIIDLGHKGQDEVRYGRYFLDCGSFISHRERENGANIIDARFIDIDTGLYIDITALAVSNTIIPSKYKSLTFANYEKNPDISPKTINQKEQIYNCRNNHFTHISQISPLYLTYMEGWPCYIPNGYLGLLGIEYGKKSLIEKHFRGGGANHRFIQKLQLWVDDKVVQNFIAGEENIPNLLPSPNIKTESALNVREFDPFQNWSDNDYCKLFTKNPDILLEYLLFRNFTVLHKQETKALESNKIPKSLIVENDNKLKEVFPRLRHDAWNFKLKQDNFESEPQLNAET